MAQDLLGVPDIAQLFGVSRQRADQLTRDDPAFPEPAETAQQGLLVRRYWRRKDVERYGKATGRL